MALRLLTSVVGIPLVLLGIFWSRPLMYLLVLLLVVMANLELAGLYQSTMSRAVGVLGMVCSLMFFAAFLIIPTQWVGAALTLIFFLVGTWAVTQYPKATVPDVAYTFFMSIYGGWAVMHILVLYEHSPWLLMSLFIAVWGCDTGAYLVGSAIGEHKLCRHLSPNKSVEGAIGGVTVSILGLIILHRYVPLFDHVSAAILFAVLCAIGGIMGDLFESYLKRSFAVKDAGSILPGHGGFLDRFDSSIFVAPLCSAVMGYLTVF